jgi:hypothetical protein
MPAHIQLKLFAALTPLSPENADRVPVSPGTSVQRSAGTFERSHRQGPSDFYQRGQTYP